MKIFISIISHGHGKLIKQLNTLVHLKDFKIKIIIKNNKPDNILTDYCIENNISIIDDYYGNGFGANNNIVFNHAKKNFNMNPCDYFIILNPDIIIDQETILNLIDEMNRKNISLSTINLFKDREKRNLDPSIRKYPTLLNFINSFLRKKNNSIIDRNNIFTEKKVDWAAGSFLAFKAEHYLTINGFNELYFMYCEDIDICYRSNKINMPIVYFPQYEAIHLARNASNSIFSKHFFWHIKSAVLFLISKKISIKIKSSIK